MKKYSYHPFVFNKRTWPDQKVKQAPIWCSVDLRDGNQALINPMNLGKKLKFFQVLVEMGFKEIEVGFPSAAQMEYNFVRHLIDNHLIPDDVTIQVLTQARKELIEKTLKSVIGAKNVIVHLYNSTSVAQRKIVFKKGKPEVINIATQGVKWIKDNLTSDHENITLQYSPESFTGTEPKFSLEICEAVMNEWLNKKIILNLPATVELFGPHVFADMIEWFHCNLKERERAVLSVHTHNDRGTGVAASELAMLAGAGRVEGTLFGNGERTGNVDIITLALNLYSHGIDPKLNVYDLNPLVRLSEECTELPVSRRHPYAGELVFTAFSGSHQDAINKGMAYRKTHPKEEWQVPYLSIDPQDIGRNYEAIIRINSQSGKGGTAYVMESDYGYRLPRAWQIDFSKKVQDFAEKNDREVLPDEILKLFKQTYIYPPGLPFGYLAIKPDYVNNNEVKVELRLQNHLSEGDPEIILQANGNGPVEAVQKALVDICGSFEIVDYQEHSLSKGADARAICYIQLERKDKAQVFFGAGEDKNITVASVKALVCGAAKLLQKLSKPELELVE